MNALSLCGIALLCFAAIQILGKDRAGFGALVGIAGTICLLAPALGSLLYLSSRLKELFEEYSFKGADSLIKAFGIGLCCEVTAQICKDAGASGLSNALDFACKCAILSLCLPLWQEVFDFIQGLLS